MIFGESSGSTGLPEALTRGDSRHITNNIATTIIAAVVKVTNHNFHVASFAFPRLFLRAAAAAGAEDVALVPAFSWAPHGLEGRFI